MAFDPSDLCTIRVCKRGNFPLLEAVITALILTFESTVKETLAGRPPRCTDTASSLRAGVPLGIHLAIVTDRGIANDQTARHKREL